MKLLNGYKTHIGLVALGLIGFAASFGWIDEETAKAVAYSDSSNRSARCVRPAS